MQTKRLTAEQIMSRANQLKDRFSGTKGKCDQMISDALSDTMNQMLQVISNLLQDRQSDETKMKGLEAKIAELEKTKRPKTIQKTVTEKK